MSHSSGDNDSQAREAFAGKIKNMIGIIQENFQGNGGNIELVSVDANNIVKVRLYCDSENCPEGQEVLKTGVEKLLKQRIPEIAEVVTVD